MKAKNKKVKYNSSALHCFDKGGGLGASGWVQLGTGAAQGIASAWQDDPLYSADAGNGFALVDTILASGNKNKVGTSLVNTGASLMNQGLSSGNGFLALAGGIAGTIGTGINAGWGYKVDLDKLNRANSAINQYNAFRSNASSFDDISLAPSLVGASNVYKGGWFVKGQAADKNARLQSKLTSALDFANRSVETNIDNISQDIINRQLGAMYANGGAIDFMFNLDYLNNGYLNAMAKNRITSMPNSFLGLGDDITMYKCGGRLHSDGGGIYIKPSKRGTFTAAAKLRGMGVLEFASKVLANKEDYSPAMVKKANFARNAAKWHAFGGTLGTNGADWTNGLTWFGNGGTHELNPNGGVPQGIAPDGQPNLVEEGEVKYNDYIYSNRLMVPKDIQEKYKLKKDITFAEAVKKLSKESQERPNDPISQNGLDVILDDLMQSQEEIRMKKQAARVKKEINKMSPEEVLALTQLQLEVPMLEAPIELIPLEPLVGACGGHLHACGGRKYDGETTPTLKMYFRTPYNSNWWHGDWDWDLMGAGSVDNLADRLKITPYADSPITSTPSAQPYYTPLSLHGSGLYPFMFLSTEDTKPAPVDNRTFAEANGGVKGNKTSTTAENNLKGKHYTEETASAPKVVEPITPYESQALNVLSLLLRPEDITRPVPGTTEKATIPSAEKREEIARATLAIANGLDSGKYPTWMRYAPIVGSALGAVSSMFDRPDLTTYNALMNASRGVGDYERIGFNPIGDYLAYTPLDRNYYLNQMRSTAAANRRAIANQAGGNRGTAMAGILASDYGALLGEGNLARQAEEYNLALRQKVAEFNRGTNMFNSEGFLLADSANQRARMLAAGQAANLIAQANAARDALKAMIAQNRSLNLTNLFNNLGNLGRENFYFNQVENNPALLYGYQDKSGVEQYKGKPRKCGGYLTIKNKKKRK